ncbi:EsV-1-21 [Ectocarpus siliculosus]|uniref:EsV-1-21 n=1 Tax=Ectocarpus siliculosus TaxID=2880 RepID=D7G2K5_ECTSI|nr:EsV-1-21 [Ectocarpus siliculosus]|eukprot:CBJ26830.1 EsV-1-21 [Ectocarpus siliculosus]
MADNNTEGREKLPGRRWTSSTFSLKTPRPKKWAEWLRAPLEAAAARGDQTLALELVGAGGASGSAVHAAVSGCHVGLAGSLLRTGAPVDGKDSQGCTALHVAAAERQLEAMDMLVQAGASLEAGGPAKCTPLDWAARHVNPASIIALLGHGAAVDGNADETVNPLFRVVLSERPTVEALPPLVRHASDVDAHGVDDETALHRLCLKAMVIPNAPEIVDLLLRWGACKEITCYGLTPLGVLNAYNSMNTDNLKRVRDLLHNAPADRAWRRRGFLVLCRAFPDRMHQNVGNNTPTAHAAVAGEEPPEAHPRSGLRHRQKAVPAATAARQGWKAAKAESVSWVATVRGLVVTWQLG